MDINLVLVDLRRLLSTQGYDKTFGEPIYYTCTENCSALAAVRQLQKPAPKSIVTYITYINRVAETFRNIDEHGAKLLGTSTEQKILVNVRCLE